MVTRPREGLPSGSADGRPATAPATSAAGRTRAAEVPAVDVSGLTVRFGPVAAVSGIDLQVRPGGSLALVGRNGAGKSSTLRVLAGVLPPTAGQVLVAGTDVRRDPLTVKHRTGYCPDVGGLVPRATPWEHLQLAARLRGMTDWQERAGWLLERFDLAGVADRVTAGFSHGMGRRLSVVLAAFHRPQVLLLDEPFDGVDPLGVEATVELIGTLRAAGCAVLVSTHLIDLAVEACTDVAVLRDGRVAARTPAATLRGPAGAGRYRKLLE